MFARIRVDLMRVSLAVGLCAAAVISPISASAAQTLNVSAGAESTGGDVQLNEFAPNQVTVGVGDTITWKLDSTEFHDIVFTSSAPAPDFVQPGPDGVFVNPVAAFPMGGSTYDGTGMVGSGLLNKGQTYSLTFSKAGSFTYLCAIHAGMGGIIKVVDNGQGVDTQQTVDARRATQVNTDLATRALPTIMANLGELPTEGATIGVASGLENGPADVQRFLPRRVTVHEGEAVTWIWKTEGTPHTVTFLGGSPAPEVIVPQPQAGGPPRLQLNPAVLAPAGEATAWNGAGYLNSGFLQPMPNQPSPTFTVRFQSTGSFDYLCLLHDNMVGTVVVLPNE
jgi:plastocyanin